MDCEILDKLFKFADDTKLLGKASNRVERDSLQSDLDKLARWSEEWEMPLNVAKCKVMHFGKNMSTDTPYTLKCEVMSSVTEEKDLGVVITADLKSSSHCQSACKKANNMLGLIYRTIEYKEQKVLVNLYKSLVRPMIEYCSSAWSPHYKKDKEMIERVQNRFTRMIPSFRQLAYEERLRRLNLWTLEERRNRADLIEVYKIFAGFTNLSINDFFTLAPCSYTRGHSRKLLKSHCRLDVRKYFFSERVIDLWNGLPEHCVTSASVNQFKAFLSTLRTTKMGFFKDE
jgi:hypothetical protein